MPLPVSASRAAPLSRVPTPADVTRALLEAQDLCEELQVKVAILEATGPGADLIAETHSLRHEIAQLRAIPTASPLAEARVLRFVGSRDTPREWKGMIVQARSNIGVVAYTFDSAAVTDGLVEARSRRSSSIPHCRVLIDGDYADRGNMSNRGPRVQLLRQRGVRVRYYRGSGALHQKTLLADRLLYVGSMNFSESSLANVERGVVMELTEEGVAAEVAEFEALWNQGRDQ